MLTKMFGKKSDHPMVDIKAAQGILDDLPKNDVYKLLGELTEWIESISEHADFKIDHQFALMRLLDEAAQPHVRKLLREYFTPNELGKFQENRLWMVLGNLSRYTAEGYYRIFNRYCTLDKGNSAIKAQLPLLLARSVNALTGQLKFVCARYGHVDKAVWTNLAQIYSHAEQQKCLDAPVSLYPGMASNTSVKWATGHLLGWYGCGVNSMKPLQMHLTERLVAQYCTSIEVHSQPGEQNLFSFDLNNPTAPRRIKVDPAAGPATRYISMAGIKPKLEPLIKTLGKKIIPGELTIGSAYDPELVSEAALYLLDYMANTPVRSGVRRNVKIDMSVAQGFEKTVERTNSGLNLNKEKPVLWKMEDISANGFLTVLPAQGSEDIRIGTMLGVQPSGVQNWGVAVVRRMIRDDQNQLHVGAEMLSTQVTPVALIQSGDGSGAFEDGQTALWLSEKPGELPGQARLMMRLDTYSDHRSLLSEYNGDDYLLIPNGLLEKCFDCDLVRFRLVKQETGPAEYH